MMAENSKIEWCHHTWNLGWGCSKKSKGCENCYAERDACRFGWDVWGKGKPRRLLSRNYYDQPLIWDKKAHDLGEKHKVFCGSMMDWTDEEWYPMLPFLWQMWRDTPNLIWLMLTKNANYIKDCLPRDWENGYPNVWHGITTENQKQANIRIPQLLKIPAKVRFLSCEPLLESIDLTKLIKVGNYIAGGGASDFPLTKGQETDDIQWVICGGESGPNKRPIDPEWARFLLKQCKQINVPFFMKQMDKISPIPENLFIREFPPTG